ncbi:MAG TPA: segregation/condensation protein A [Candidatus Omnitrophota bacterium]|nr:segregation/condensation protein A [Candidatus Omnitrophota bacterium]HRZ15453.1 segregation/condensation protein A [Candidatus Omnitrophota bacterium]
MSYKIKIELFEGPLDLLLYLVKKDHLNIYDIPITQVTEQYLQYLDLMKFLDLNIAGEFLVMAATLLQIKSKMLLPAQENEQVEEEDPRADLVQQLLEYERFKEIAQELKKRETEQQDIFKRPRIIEKEIPAKDGAVDFFEASIFDLISAFSRALQETPRDVFYNVIKEEFTIEQKVHDILHDLLLRSSLTLSGLFARAKSKIEIIVTFLAVLELTRMKEIIACQREHFGEIEIIRNQNNIVPVTRADQTDEKEDQTDARPDEGRGQSG